MSPSMGYDVNAVKSLINCCAALLSVSALLDATGYAVMKLLREGNLN